MTWVKDAIDPFREIVWYIRTKWHNVLIRRRLSLEEIGDGMAYVLRSDLDRLRGTAIKIPGEGFGHTQIPPLFCATCRGSDGMPLPLQGLGREYSGEETHKCTGCKEKFVLASDRDR